MAKMPSDPQEQLPQGESPFPPEPSMSGSQNPYSDRLHFMVSLPPLGAIAVVIGLVVLTIIAVLVVQNITQETPTTPAPTLVVLQAQATELAMLMETQTSVAQVPTLLLPFK
jgi:cytoskeletal protein RodZ